MSFKHRGITIPTGGVTHAELEKALAEKQDIATALTMEQVNQAVSSAIGDAIEEAY